ncbi:hypothetical protein ACYPKM_00455 [Pseudomonas aeruginosa]
MTENPKHWYRPLAALLVDMNCLRFVAHVVEHSRVAEICRSLVVDADGSYKDRLDMLGKDMPRQLLKGLNDGMILRTDATTKQQMQLEMLAAVAMNAVALGKPQASLDVLTFLVEHEGKEGLRIENEDAWLERLGFCEKQNLDEHLVFLPLANALVTVQLNGAVNKVKSFLIAGMKLALAEGREAEYSQTILPLMAKYREVAGPLLNIYQVIQAEDWPALQELACISSRETGHPPITRGEGFFPRIGLLLEQEDADLPRLLKATLDVAPEQLHEWLGMPGQPTNDFRFMSAQGLSSVMLGIKQHLQDDADLWRRVATAITAGVASKNWYTLFPGKKLHDLELMLRNVLDDCDLDTVFKVTSGEPDNVLGTMIMRHRKDLASRVPGKLKSKALARGMSL